jgi:hypothetical protein
MLAGLPLASSLLHRCSGLQGSRFASSPSGLVPVGIDASGFRVIGAPGSRIEGESLRRRCLWDQGSMGHGPLDGFSFRDWF